MSRVMPQMTGLAAQFKSAVAALSARSTERKTRKAAEWIVSSREMLEKNVVQAADQAAFTSKSYRGPDLTLMRQTLDHLLSDQKDAIDRLQKIGNAVGSEPLAMAAFHAAVCLDQTISHAENMLERVKKDSKWPYNMEKREQRFHLDTYDLINSKLDALRPKPLRNAMAVCGLKR